MSREAMERAIATIVEMRNELAYGSRAFAGSIQTLALLRAALSAPAQQQAGTVQVPCFVILGPDDSTKFVSFAEDEDWAWIHYIDSLKLWYCAIKDKNGSHRIPGHRCIPASIVFAAAHTGEDKP